MNENAIKNFSLSRARAFFACALALALVAVVLVPLAVFGASGRWDKPLAALLSSDEAVRAAAFQELGAGVPDTVIPALLGWMKGLGRNPAASEVVRRLGGRAVPALITKLKDPEVGNRAADLLFMTSGPEMSSEMPAVLDCAKDPETGEICGRILVRLMSPKGGRYRSMLEEALKGKDPLVRVYAAGALGQLGAKGKAAVPALVEALKDPVPSVRWSAAVALGNIGKKAQAAVPALEALAADPNGQVRTLAKQALEKVR